MVPIDPALKAHLVSSARVKIARADEHLATLYEESDRWGEGDPFHIVRERDAEGRQHIFRLRFKSPPDVWRWGVILGDALHNLRGALDHMIYVLAVNQTGVNPPDDDAILAFPITSDDGHFRKAERRIRSLNQRTQAAIERAQPYNRGKPFLALWWLAQLNDADKHRLAHLSPVAARHDTVAVGAEKGTFQAHWNIGPLVDRTPVLQLVLDKPDPDLKVELKATAAVVISVEGVRPLGLHPTMKAIRREVVTVCRYLSCFFVERPTG